MIDATIARGPQSATNAGGGKVTQKQRVDNDDWRKAISRLLLALTIAGMLFGVAEIACRALVSPDRLDTILTLLERDPLLIWRLQAGLDVEFEGQQVRTNEHHTRGAEFTDAREPGRYRIVCMGPSPTFGWGVAEDDTYSAVAERLLSRQGLPVEVINAGVPGYTSWQGRNWLARDVVRWQPDLVTVAYDLNDMDIFRFFRNDGRPDAAQQPENPLLIAAQNRLNRSFAYRLFRGAMIGAMSRGGAFDPAAMPRRVDFDDYRANMLAIEQTCRDHGIKLIFCKMPVNLPFYRLRAVDADAARNEWAQGSSAVARDDWKSAREHYEKAYELDSTMPKIYTALARAREQTGDREGAQEIWRLLPFVAAFRDRADRQYNRIVEETAQQTGRPWLDVVTAFATDGRGMGLWNSEEDPFHPNAAGHAIIGEMLAAIAGPLLPQYED